MKAKIELQHRNRDRQHVLESMQAGIILFNRFLQVSNGQPLHEEENQVVEKSLETSPINFTERMKFVTSRPELYHSFAVLAQLFDEQVKLYHKNQAIKKASRKTS